MAEEYGTFQVSEVANKDDEEKEQDQDSDGSESEGSQAPESAILEEEEDDLAEHVLSPPKPPKHTPLVMFLVSIMGLALYFSQQNNIATVNRAARSSHQFQQNQPDYIQAAVCEALPYAILGRPTAEGVEINLMANKALMSTGEASSVILTVRKPTPGLPPLPPGPPPGDGKEVLPDARGAEKESTSSGDQMEDPGRAVSPAENTDGAPREAEPWSHVLIQHLTTEEVQSMDFAAKEGSGAAAAAAALARGDAALDELYRRSGLEDAGYMRTARGGRAAAEAEGGGAGRRRRLRGEEAVAAGGQWDGEGRRGGREAAAAAVGADWTAAAWGEPYEEGELLLRSEQLLVLPDRPTRVALNGLDPDTRYTYGLEYRNGAGCGRQALAQAGHFTTRRARGRPFNVAVLADAHFQDPGAYDPEVFRATLGHVRESLGSEGGLDLLFDLGDTFMGGKLAPPLLSAPQLYTDVAAAYAPVAASLPVFVANGNHDGMEGFRIPTKRGLEEQEASDPLNYARLKNLYFLNPTADLEVPGGTYAAAGDFEFPSLAADGGPNTYFAAEWGDALFAVLDPYWYTRGEPPQKARDGWAWSLGYQQYDWLHQTLSQSTAPFKFVFIHALVGGAFEPERGTKAYSGTGDERYARYFEWGGLGEDGEEAFATRRPGWEHGPVHQMLVDHGVSAVFRGHDHLWYDGVLDGVHYTTVPKSSVADPLVVDGAMAAEKGYDPARVSVQSGHVEVRVRSPAEAAVEFVSYREAGDPLAVTGLGYALSAPSYDTYAPGGGDPALARQDDLVMNILVQADPVGGGGGAAAEGGGGGGGGRVPSLSVRVPAGGGAAVLRRPAASGESPAARAARLARGVYAWLKRVPAGVEEGVAVTAAVALVAVLSAQMMAARRKDRLGRSASYARLG